MCGIAGWAEIDTSPRPKDQLVAMTQTLFHRGPDGEGYCRINGDANVDIGFGHRRLAIIDIAGGAQPFVDPDQRGYLTFNGELYNYRELRRELEAAKWSFRTNSDTEVFLNACLAWGAEALPRFRGMFAFAFWDRGRQELMLGRDPFGKKPLYLQRNGRNLYFASEIKALNALALRPREIDTTALWHYAQYRYVPGPATLFHGIEKLPPGHVAFWHQGEFSSKSYYRPPDRCPRDPVAVCPDPITAFRTVFDQAVQKRMVSDVPYGAFLSGGIDSTALVAHMSRRAPGRVKTFSVGFAEAAYSELNYAGQVAKAFGTDHHPIEVDASAIADHLPHLVRFRDAPVAEPSDVPIFLLSKHASNSVKMVLTGEGADEILAGYPKHRAEGYVSFYQSVVPNAVHRHVIAPIVESLPYRFRRVKTAAAAIGCRDPRVRFPQWFGAFDPDGRDELLTIRPNTTICQDPFDVEPGVSALRRILYFDQTSWLPDNLLERGDRMTMAASIEARMPFMDIELIEAVSGLPDRYRLRRGRSKWILRAALKGLVPDEILHRPKLGFRLPVNEWFRGPLRTVLADTLLAPSAGINDFMSRKAVRRIIDQHVQGQRNFEKHLWTLLSLEIFLKECMS